MTVVRLRVKEVAKQKGVSQGLLGRLANVDTNTMRKIYREPDRANIGIVILNRLANALDVDVRELLESVEEDE